MHLTSLSMNYPYSINYSLKNVLMCLVKFICQHIFKSDNANIKSKGTNFLIKLILDVRTEFLHEIVNKALDKLMGNSDTEEYQRAVYLYAIEKVYNLINYSSTSTSKTLAIDEKVLHHCIKFLENIIEKPIGYQAFATYFNGEKDLIKILISASSSQKSQQYSTRVLQFFNKLFQVTEKSSEKEMKFLSASICKLVNLDKSSLNKLFHHIIIGQNVIQDKKITTKETESQTDPQKSFKTIESQNEWAEKQNLEVDSSTSSTSIEDNKNAIQENCKLLQSLANFIVQQNAHFSEDVSMEILKALLPIGSYILSKQGGTGFIDLMAVKITLADAGTGKGHMYLFPNTIEWLHICKQYLEQKEIIDLLKNDPESGKNNTILESACHILDYIFEILNIVCNQVRENGFRSLSPPWEFDAPLDNELESYDDDNDEEESGEDSDDDSLCNKLCTFTITQKEFMNQHWYHCHTCRMLDGVGVCSICAKVCHKGHDLSYAKYGNFFCDCGAKEDGSCQALTRRTPHTALDGSTGNGTMNMSSSCFPENILTSSLRRQTFSPVMNILSFEEKKSQNIVKQLKGSKDWINNFLSSNHVAANILELAQTIMPVVESVCNRTSSVGSYVRGTKALHQLHFNDKKYIQTDQLMTPTLGSQEGAFENVRMSFAGEQGQTIRQLLSAHIIRRVAMCCLFSTHGKRQHLAVSHEKGKITILQLSSLLKQADTSTRKLTLTRLSSAPIPFTVISLSNNICNEDFLAVCGLKDCHVLMFTASGSVSEHLVLHPQLETGNFIIKAIWLPGSQTQLALVTADFVKIYDLSKDILSPKYYFLVPSGKIRDCTFMFYEGVYNILIMSSPGHIYIETLNKDSSAEHGTFYITNTLDVLNLDITVRIYLLY